MANFKQLLAEIFHKNITNLKKEKTLLRIGTSIQQHRSEEVQFGYPHIGIARAECTINGLKYPQKDLIIWITNSNNLPFQYMDAGEITISKNTKVAGILITELTGLHHYQGPTGYDFDIGVFNLASYTPEYNRSAKEITIHIDGDKYIYKYETLQQLLSETIVLKEKIKEEEESKRKLEEESRIAKEAEKTAREAMLKAEEAERKRLEEEARIREQERILKEENEKRKNEEIAKLEEEYKKAQERANTFRNFIRGESVLRSQHILDPSQEKAKRSHIYDGIPLVIEGGPGTGKTTTMIQRLKFLLDVDALKDYESPLKSNQIKELTDRISEKWLFFSPSSLLLQFLMNNMNGEGLSAVEGKNVITINDFRNEMLSTYHLYNMDTNGPFRSYKSSAGKLMIKQQERAIKDFEYFCVQNSVEILLAASKMETASFSWHRESFGIKAICRNAEKVKDIESLMRLFNSLYDNEGKKVVEKEKRLDELVKNAAHTLQSKILEDETQTNNIKALFKQWEEERNGEVADVEENEMDVSNEEENIEELILIDFNLKLYNFLKSLIKRVALMQIDPKKKMYNRQKQIYDLVEMHIHSIDTKEIGELEFFSKRFAFLCKGIESNIVNQIPRLYKVYRKKVLIDDKNNIYNKEILKSLIEKDNNKHLHFDEQDLLIGFINNLAIGIRKRSKDRYEKMAKRCVYIRAYEDNKKPVIGIDEATDYTILDYYFMYSFRNYEYSSVTLCGDIMQGLNKHGIMSWSELNGVLPGLKVNTLNISYRQIPTLVEMSKKIYYSEQGTMPPYHSHDIIKEGEPQPLAFISDEEDEKKEWIVERLREVYIAYGKEIPSIAIFIPDGSNVDSFVKELKEIDGLGEIKVSAGKETSITKAVKVYELSEVKGMEFEVVFFYDLDKALQGRDTALMKRHLYVGISRATSHLAALFCKKEGNEEILSYFSQDCHNWKIGYKIDGA